MKKLFFAVAMLTALMSANAQTRVTAIEGDDLAAIPSKFTLSGTPQLVIRTDEGVCVYDANLQLLRSITIESEEIDFGWAGAQRRTPVEDGGTGEWEWEIQYPANWSGEALTITYNDVDETGVMNHDNEQMAVTQTLFNNDEDYESIWPNSITCVFDTNVDGNYRYISPHFYYTGLQVRGSNGEVLHTLACDEGWMIDEWEDNISIIKIGNKVYLSFKETNGENDHVVFFRIDREQESITRVEEALPIAVRPSVAARGEQITVELGENATATEIEVINAVGQRVKRVPVQAGLREVKFSVDNSGLHLINARRGNRQGTIKIIVR